MHSATVSQHLLWRLGSLSSTAALCLCLCGCLPSPLARRTSAFAKAATATTANTEQAYDLVESTYREAQLAHMVARYDEAGFDIAELKPFLPEQDRKVRVDVIEGLQSYAELLAGVSGDQSLVDVDTSAKSLGASLQTLSANKLIAAKLTSTDATLAASAIDALGRALIESKRRRELPIILHNMQQPIETICALISLDIGDPAHSGLRDELHINYLDLLREQKNYIADNKDKLTPFEKREEVRVLARLATSESRADLALARTQKALARLAQAHTALALTARQKNAPAFQLQMEQFAASARQLKSLYDTSPDQK